jgi:hypothetical protein
MKNIVLIKILSMAVILSACSLENTNPEKLERGHGIYINSGFESDVFEHVASGYRNSEECESNEIYIDSMSKCVIGIDVDNQISSGLVVHRKFVKEVEGRKFYRLLVSMPDGSVIEKG